MSYTKISGPSWADVSPGGLITFTAPSPGTFPLTVGFNDGQNDWSKVINLVITENQIEEFFSVSVVVDFELNIYFDSEITLEFPSYDVETHLDINHDLDAELIWPTVSPESNISFNFDADVSVIQNQAVFLNELIKINFEVDTNQSLETETNFYMEFEAE